MLIRKTLGRAEIVEIVGPSVGLSRSDSQRVVEQLLRRMSAALLDEGWVKISSFGTFEVRQKRARQGRNPKTLELAEISARRILCFRPGSNLCKRVNEG